MRSVLLSETESIPRGSSDGTEFDPLHLLAMPPFFVAVDIQGNVGLVRPPAGKEACFLFADSGVRQVVAAEVCSSQSLLLLNVIGEVFLVELEVADSFTVTSKMCPLLSPSRTRNATLMKFHQM